MSERCPDFIPSDWENTPKTTTDYGTVKQYNADGVRVIIVEAATSDLILNPSKYETHYPDSTVHFEYAHDEITMLLATRADPGAGLKDK